MALEYDYIDIISAKEGWNEYELEDKTILKAKFALIKVIKEKVYDPSGNPVYSFNSRNLMGIFSARELRGTPDQRRYNAKKIADNVEKEDLDIKPLKPEVWSVYRLKDGTTLSIKLTLVKVSRTSLKDARGEPIYSIRTQPIVKVKIPKKLRSATKKQPVLKHIA